MSFLAPLFLLGGLAVALPIIFHLIRRTTRERMPFSSLMFLQPSPPRLTRRSRLEHILLLLLRSAVICLLAFGFARPFLKKPVAPDAHFAGARRIVVLVDVSASMRRGNLWASARARTESVLRKASPADQIALFTFDRQMTPLVSFEQWNSTPASDRASLATRKLDELSPGWSSTHLGNALITAAEALADTSGNTFSGVRQIILISDLQEGSQLDLLQGYEWPKGIELSVESLKERPASNAGLQLITSSDEADPKAASGVRVRVTNAAGSTREQLKVGWAQAEGSGFLEKPIEIYVPAGQSRTLNIPVPTNSASADRIVLQGDDDDFDNTVFVIPPEQLKSTVLYFGTDSEKDSRQSLYFLQRAFQDTRRQAVEVSVRRPDQPLSPSELETASFFIVTGPLPNEQARTFREYVLAGKTLLFALADENTSSALATLLSIPNPDVQEARQASPTSYAMLAQIDFKHPLFAPFADSRFSDFTKIHFWKYRRLDAAAIPNARVLAKFDSGESALLEVPTGKGRVLVLTSGWRIDDSQLALSTKFVPLLYSLLEQSGTGPFIAAQAFVGDIVPVSPLAGSEHASAKVQTPTGEVLNLAVGATNFSQTLSPGIYTLVSPDHPRRFAVNLDPSESRTAPMPADELERLGVPVSHGAPSPALELQRKARLQNSELENRQKLWRILLISALAVLLFETWLAGRIARKTVPASP